MTAKNKGGRPTIFDRSMIDGAKEYVWFFQLSEEKREELKDGRINPVEVIPSVSGLALYLGVARSTLYEWEEINKEFSDTLGNLKSVQEVLLLNSGLQGKFNAQITKLALSTPQAPNLSSIDRSTTNNRVETRATVNVYTSDNRDGARQVGDLLAKQAREASNYTKSSAGR